MAPWPDPSSVPLGIKMVETKNPSLKQKHESDLENKKHMNMNEQNDKKK